jgi:uncharacterized membrane protein (GlpM family)
MKNIITYFLTGGIFTTLIVLLEQSGFRLLSGLAALIPVFTLVSYIFIGESKGGLAVSQHSQFVLWGTIVSWIPYMISIAYLSPKIGPIKAIIAGMAVFFILAILFLLVAERYKLFR